MASRVEPRVQPAASSETGSENLVALSPAMLEAIHLAHVYARVPDPPEPVVIVGETGVGKTTLARLIHTLSGRPGILVERSCGELSSSLAPDELFGHEKGAFTGALSRRAGAIAEAFGGSLLLDEFHLLRRPQQWLLLRLLGSWKVATLGSDREREPHLRLIIGVSTDPDQLVADGTLLLDLRRRLGWQIIYVPPLRERRVEIAPLAQRFLEECLRADGVEMPRDFAPAVIHAFEAAPWPMNVGELRGVVRAAYPRARFEGRKTIGLEDLPPTLGAPPRYDPRSDLTTQLRVAQWALDQTGGRVDLAAELAGMHRNTMSKLRRRLRTSRGAVCAAHTAGPIRVQGNGDGDGERRRGRSSNSK